MAGDNLRLLLVVICVTISTALSCDNREKKRAPFNCREYDECTNGEWMRQSCELGEYFDGEKCGFMWKVNCTVENCEKGRKYSRGYCQQNYDYCYFGIILPRHCPPNQAFNGEQCVAVEKCKNAKEDQPVLTKEVEKFFTLSNKQKKCTDGMKIFHPTDCTMYQLCQEGQWVNKSCPWLHHYDSITDQCLYWQYTCTYGQPCIENETKSVYGRCSDYLKCVHYRWVQFSCAKGTYFQQGKCQSKPCPLRPVLNNCSYFMEPENDKMYKCPGKQLFDKDTRECVASQASCLQGECMSGNTSYVPSDCKKYKLCVNYNWTETCCGWLKHYDVHSKQCKYFSYTCGPAQQSIKSSPQIATAATPTCNQDGEVRAVKHDCKHYHVCKHGRWNEERCYVWGKFDSSTKQCYYIRMWKVNCA